ncbi:GSCFA domain-containing protein [uncultured Pontibacter sp.]|uniref:GSCFA domain-containing protein n=1 Tax=uncultured Pontibacter sp. TaxID=453356 RepID=UPI00262C2EBA|nr:GSCFA domain-containing protein [uncultured Pontibacter sp.]
MFRTEVDVPNTGLNVTLQDKVLTIGSCFAEVIGNKLQQHKVDVLTNPFGTLFNPVSVCQLLNTAAGTPYNFESHLVQHNGIWYAYDLHSSISSPDKNQLLKQIQERLQITDQYLQTANLLIITLGTAVAYKLLENGNVVANCHKLPSKHFNRLLLNLQDTLHAFEQTLQLLKSINPKLKVVLTVSPVRHVKETLTMNSVSKSQLRLLCHYLQERYQEVLYFPAYEIMMDDLRDYRYYKDDMLHPTTLAENYIWDKFINAYYEEQFKRFAAEWGKLSKALVHRPFHPESEGHQAFLKNTITQLKQLSEKYKINTTSEIEYLTAQLKS